MEIKFKVFSIDNITTEVPATLKGGDVVTAKVQATRLQLIPDESDVHSTVALVLTGSDAAEAEKLKVGERVSFTLKKG